MPKSKTKIEKQMQKKANKELVKTIIAAKKNKKWNKIASILSGPRRKKININLDKINSETKTGEIIVVPGKVLSLGEVNKKVKVIAFSFSKKAKEKLLKAGCEVSSILSEIKKNKDTKEIKILK